MSQTISNRDLLEQLPPWSTKNFEIPPNTIVLVVSDRDNAQLIVLKNFELSGPAEVAVSLCYSSVNNWRVALLPPDSEVEPDKKYFVMLNSQLWQEAATTVLSLISSY